MFLKNVVLNLDQIPTIWSTFIQLVQEVWHKEEKHNDQADRSQLLLWQAGVGDWVHGDMMHAQL